MAVLLEEKIMSVDRVAEIGEILKSTEGKG
jgi:hypothetical protein